jgi:hypothetical protein
LLRWSADLHDQRDTFGIAWFGFGRLVGLGPELPGVRGTENGNHDSVRTIGVALAIAMSSDSVMIGLLMMAASWDDRSPQVADLPRSCREDCGGV